MNAVATSSLYLKLKGTGSLFQFDREIIIAWLITHRNQEPKVFRHLLPIQINKSGSWVRSGISGTQVILSFLWNLNVPSSHITFLTSFTRECQLTLIVNQESSFQLCIAYRTVLHFIHVSHHQSLLDHFAISIFHQQFKTGCPLYSNNQISFACHFLTVQQHFLTIGCIPIQYDFSFSYHHTAVGIECFNSRAVCFQRNTIQLDAFSRS